MMPTQEPTTSGDAGDGGRALQRPTPPVYAGPNAGLVNEVIACAFGESLLTGTGAGEPPRPLTVVADIVAAIVAAGGTDPRRRIRIEYSEMQWLLGRQDLSEVTLETDWPTLQAHLAERLIRGPGGWAWGERHGHELAPVVALATRTGRSDPAAPALVARVAERLPELPAGPERRRQYHRDFVVKRIASDLVWCAENRARNGMTANHWETLFQTYCAGLWPCGWQGTWPAPGNLIAWRPPGGS